MKTPEFAVGASVILSELGRRNSRSPDKRGRIVGVSRTGSAYRVLWNELKTADFVHVTFLQPCEERAPAPAAARTSNRRAPAAPRNAKPDQLLSRIALSGASNVQTRPSGA